MVGDFTARFDPALALWRIEACSATAITTRTKPNPPDYLILEALAQTCGMHARWLHDFREQVFLVSLAGLVYPDDHGAAGCLVQAELTGQTGAAFSYAARLDNGPACRVTMGRLPTAPDTTLFRERFQCLITPSPNV